MIKIERIKEVAACVQDQTLKAVLWILIDNDYIDFTYSETILDSIDNIAELIYMMNWDVNTIGDEMSDYLSEAHEEHFDIYCKVLKHGL